VREVPEETTGLLVYRVQRVKMASKGPRESQVAVAIRVIVDLKDPWVQRAKQGQQENKGHKDLRECTELRESKGRTETRDPRGHQVCYAVIL
jgi:hypothetical protein